MPIEIINIYFYLSIYSYLEDIYRLIKMKFHFFKIICAEVAFQDGLIFL